mgnify:CR=1 FL=1
MKKNSSRKVHQFLHDRKFVNWALNPNEKLNKYWHDYMSMHKDEEEEIQKAIVLLKGMHRYNEILSDKEIDLLWQRVANSIHKEQKQKVNLWRKWAAAASILVLLSVGGFFFPRFYQSKNSIDYTKIARVEPNSDDIVLILSDKKHKTFSYDKVEVEYDKDGNICVNEKKIDSEAERSEIKETTLEKEPLNQIVIPYGKHSCVVLADGSKMYLNSGSRAIYPARFVKKERQVYIEGEAYFDVAKDLNRKFIVKTKDIDIEVLGTKFNVSSYPEDALASVVLLEGSVKASVNNEDEIKMKPNEILKYERQIQQTRIGKTNAAEYISWINGWLICNSENLANVLMKLARYYNVNIEISPKVKTLTLSGKLDLKTNCEDVLKAIVLTAPIVYTKVNNKYQVGIKH